MATVLENTIDEDSRTATFERKRPHDIDSGSNFAIAESQTATPRKRTKHTGKPGHQDVPDFVPSGASFTTDIAYIQDGQGGEEKEEEKGEGYSEEADAQFRGSLSPAGGTNEQETDLPVSQRNHERIESPAKLGTETTNCQTSNGYPESVGHVTIQDTAEIDSRANESASMKALGMDDTVDSPANETTTEVSIREGRRLYIGNAPFTMEEKHLSEFFQGFPIESIRILINSNTSRPTGYAFVDLATSEAAEAAISQLSGKHILARKVSVQLARSPTTVTSFRTEVAEDSFDLVAKDKGDETNQNIIQEIDKGTDENRHDVTTESSSKLSWNAVNNIKIRTTLGGGLGKVLATKEETPENSHEVQTKRNQGQAEVAEAEESKHHSEKLTPQDEATRTALSRLESFRDRVAGMDPHDGPVSAYKTARVELENAEIDYNYCVYYPCNEYFSPPPKQNRIGSGNITANQQRRWRIWNSARKSMEEGNLQDLKDGKLTGTGAGSVIEKPRGKLSTGESHIERNAGQIPPSFVHVKRKDSESDGELILNTYSDHNMPLDDEINQLPNKAVETTDERTASDRTIHDEISNKTSETESESDAESESASEYGDDMMDYMNDSNSIHMDGDNTGRSNHAAKSETNTSRVLADLNSQDLNAQIRYFYVTTATSNIDLRNTPVRCLVCAEQGHVAEACESLNCGSCGLRNHHTTQHCPSTKKCSKCREEGHDNSRCPYKLKNMPTSEIICDICQRNGHSEEDCELLWRTSGRPWDFDVASKTLRLSCYECGRSGHLGNDCPTRKPGKALGSSSWGSGKDQLSIKSKNEIKIKGSARQDPIDIDEDDELGKPFVRPKLTEPVQKGKIQIKTANPRFRQQSPQFGRNIHNLSNERVKPAQQQGNQFRSGGQGQRVSANKYTERRPNIRRSVSPDRRDHGGYGPVDRYQAPSQGRYPAPSGDNYRPMPSSARNAWSRHRT